MELSDALTRAGISFLKDEPMSVHTTFRVGGAADWFLLPKTEEQLKEALRLCREHGIEPIIVGNGSNLLVSDSGIRGEVVCLSMMEEVSFTENMVTAAAGLKLWKLCHEVQKRALSGLVFAYGIPGTLGGAVYMNAGAYGGEMKDIVASVRALLPDGAVKDFSNEECGFSYRHSVFQENGAVILSAKLQLTSGDEEQIAEEMKQLLKKRRDKQPLEYPSAGSVFKRPTGHFAAALIEEAGLKGFAVGGAQVSEKHAGFIINKGYASCTEVEAVIRAVQEKVYQNSGIRLECEIKKIG